MDIGKLPNNVLEELVINTLKPKREEVLVRPEIGEDCTAFDLDGDICVMSTDPITGATKNLGKIAVNIAINDIASTGAEPFGIMITLLIPPDGTVPQLKEIMQDINESCDKLNIDILGGHTEVTDAVNRFVIISTAVGKTNKESMIQTKNAKTDDLIFVTKDIALEGTSIIISEKKDLLKDILTKADINDGLEIIDDISVLKEGNCGRKASVNSMHDITEGGILGAIWELCNSSYKGAIIYYDKLPIKEVTLKVCDYFNIDPLKLISSGSMLISCSEENSKKLIIELEKVNVKVSLIGKVTDNKDIILKKNNDSIIITEPKSDELYKVI